MHSLRPALLLSLCLTLAAPPILCRADEPKKPADASAQAPAVRPPQPKDEPTVPSVKGANDQQKAQYTARHEGFMKDKEALLAKGPIQLVLLGDSITDGWRGKNAKQIFDAAFGKYNAFNTGIGGDRTQHVLWRIDNGELDGYSAKVAMLMIGTNNTGPNPSDEAIADGIKACVEEIHKHQPTAKVLLLGVFPRNVKKSKEQQYGEPDEPIRARIKHINQIISQLDDGGKTVKYLDIGDKFLDKDGRLSVEVMPDFLHPNAKGYQIWADAVTPTLEEMMK